MGSEAETGATSSASGWPSLAGEEWAATRDTMQLWTQIVGKIRLAHSPLLNHWWNVPLYVTARGLTTSLMWTADERGFQIDFDFVTHRLEIVASDGASRSVALEPRPVAEFYSEVTSQLEEIGINPNIWSMPVEIDGAVPFDEDRAHASYDRELVEKFWQVLITTSHVFNEFRTTFVGKSSPVHLFWGGLDLATTRFSGRAAPSHPGGAPHCGPHVMREAYSQEVSSAGYWPGAAGEGAFYSYAYPEPDGYREAAVTPAEAHFDDGLGEYLLAYEAVRTADDPRAVLLGFLQITYEAAADRAGWDRDRLERPPPPWTKERVALPGPFLRPRPG